MPLTLIPYSMMRPFRISIGGGVLTVKPKNGGVSLERLSGSAKKGKRVLSGTGNFCSAVSLNVSNPVVTKVIITF